MYMWGYSGEEKVCDDDDDGQNIEKLHSNLLCNFSCVIVYLVREPLRYNKSLFYSVVTYPRQ
jgi:hypothetical protein